MRQQHSIIVIIMIATVSASLHDFMGKCVEEDRTRKPRNIKNRTRSGHRRQLGLAGRACGICVELSAQMTGLKPGDNVALEDRHANSSSPL